MAKILSIAVGAIAIASAMANGDHMDGGKGKGDHHDGGDRGRGEHHEGGHGGDHGFGHGHEGGDHDHRYGGEMSRERTAAEDPSRALSPLPRGAR